MTPAQCGLPDGQAPAGSPDHPPPPSYTVILPVREGRGTSHLDESVGSLLRLSPPSDELLFGVVEGSSGSLAARLSSICGSSRYKGHRIVAVPR